MSPLVAAGMLAFGLLIPVRGDASPAAGEMSATSSEQFAAKPVAGPGSVPVLTAADAAALIESPADAGEPQGSAQSTAADTPLGVAPQTPRTVRLWVGGALRTLVTHARSVDELLREQHLVLGASDRISPSVTAPLAAGSIVRITPVRSWERRIRQPIAMRTIRRHDAHLERGRSRILSAGSGGVRELVVRYTQQQGAGAQRAMVLSRILRIPRPRIIAVGVGRFTSFARVAERGIDSTFRLAHSALEMIATAYTGNCAGCTGFAANGSRVKVGLVAVDPAVIPLGTRLFIPGYGRAVAGDTGGAIVGHRIDLGFGSNAEALAFGRRPVKVYVLR